jgi:hypothetical protein
MDKFVKYVLSFCFIRVLIAAHSAEFHRPSFALNKLSLFFLTLSLSIASANAVTWYVDSSLTGSSLNNGTNWSTAWTNVTSISGVSAGDTVYISGGASGSTNTYYLNSTWFPASGSGLTTPITYQIGQDPSHDGTALFQTSNGNIYWVEFGNYINLLGYLTNDTNMHFAIGSGYIQGIDLNGAQGCRVAYINFGNSMGTANTGGIDDNGTSAYLEIDHNYCMIAPGIDNDHFCTLSIIDTSWGNTKIHNNTVILPRSPTSGGGADGFQITGWNFDFYSNDISGYFLTGYNYNQQHQDGIQMLEGHNIRIFDNYFHNLGNSCVFMDGYLGPFYNVYIFNNRLAATTEANYLAGDGGIECGGDGGPGVPDSEITFTNIIVANNLASDMNGSGSQNAIVMGNDTSYSSPYVNCIIANNTLINSGNVLLFANNNPDQITLLSNVVMTIASNNGDFVSYNFLATNNNFNLTTNATSLIGHGTNLSTYFTTDANGNTRPATTNWDIGPYQYMSGGTLGTLPAPVGLQVTGSIP